MAVKFDYDKVEALSGRGLTKEQIILCLGVSKNWFYKKKKQDKRFEEALDRGKSKAVAACTAKLMSHIEKGNLTALIFWLKCQAGWKETQVIEHKEAAPIPGSDCSPEEAEAAYIKAMRGA